MSVIQKIRDKYARISVIAIAISLLGFILMDAFAGRTGLFNNGPGSTIGKVDGTKINREAFQQKVDLFESQYRGQQLTEEQKQQIQEEVWNQEIEDIILKKEYEKLGITVTEKEMNEMLYGANPPQFLTRFFSDPKTGAFDAFRAKQQVNQALKTGTVDEKNFFNMNIEMLKRQRLMSKYMSMLVNSIYMPKWFVERLNADNALMAKFSYVNIPYGSIPDSAVKVTDDEIKDYMKKHKNLYEQKEETRSISYVVFNASATSSDSAIIRNELDSLKSGFISTTDAPNYVVQQSSSLQYLDNYLAQSAIQIPVKDSIFKLAKGAVYGPYLDGNSYVMAKLIDSKSLPDSVKCRHILSGTMNPQTGQPMMSDSIAKVKADSIAVAIRNGANFDTLNVRYSTDEVAKKDKGVMTFSATDIQGENFAKEFGQFILFDGKPGDKKVVKTNFGYHYIEILEYKNVQPYYKIAYLGRKIVPSPETDDAAHNQANLFAGDSRDLKSFNDNWDKKLRTKGVNKSPAVDIKAMDNSIIGLPPGRQLIRTIFDADEGDVIGPEKVGESYVVAVVTEVNEPGYKSVNSVRSMVEPVIMNEKKADIIIKNIGKVTTPEDVAAKQKPAQQVQTVDSVRFGGASKIGPEPKVLGAVFNPANKGKVVPEAIAGTQGVFVVRVDNTTTVPVESANIEEQRKNYESGMKQSLMNQFRQNVNPIVDALKRIASIKDNRATYY